MSYNPVTDFLGMLRQTALGPVELARMPGMDCVLSAMARAGIITLSVGQTAPTVNQATTVWLQPALPSWTAEGKVFIWNPTTAAYELATPALWDLLLTGSPYVFQSAPVASNVIGDTTSLLAIQRAAPAATTLILPTIASRLGKALQIVDWSSAVADHLVTLTPAGGASIMRLTSWQLLSTADQLTGITLYPSADLNGWVIAP